MGDNPSNERQARELVPLPPEEQKLVWELVSNTAPNGKATASHQSMLTIKNNEQEIIETNFWRTEYARRGVFYLSANAGAFRLLVPQAHESALAEFRTAKEVVISRGPWTAQGGRDALEILFDDGSDDPYALHLDAKQLDRIPATDDAGKDFVFTAWTWAGKPICAFRHECYYRIVPSLPWLKPRV
jgi:hypothetical protein